MSRLVSNSPLNYGMVAYFAVPEKYGYSWKYSEWSFFVAMTLGRCVDAQWPHRSIPP